MATRLWVTSAAVGQTASFVTLAGVIIKRQIKSCTRVLYLIRNRAKSKNSGEWVPFDGALLEGVDDLIVVAELTDEAFLSTQAAAKNVGAGKLDYLGQVGSQFPINHLQGAGSTQMSGGPARLCHDCRVKSR